MKLYFSPTSPYVRKVRLAAHHLGLADRITLVPAATTPVSDDPELPAVNPLGKIPALVLDDGRVLFDSRVIVEYLDDAAGGGLIPRAGDAERWETLRLQALADGLLDAALLMRYEAALRPPERQWRDWIEGQRRKIERAITVLGADVQRIEAGAAPNGICAACALGYLDFRMPQIDWRAAQPQLAAFYARFSERAEMALTDPRNA